MGLLCCVALPYVLYSVLLQVEPARKVQELSDAAQQLLTTATQHLLLLGAAAGQGLQQQQVYVQAACDMQEAWDSYSQAAAAAAGAAQQQLLQQQDAADGAAGGSGQQSIADTVLQLRHLHGLLQHLQQLPAKLLQHNHQQQHNPNMLQLQQVQQQAAGLLQQSSTLLQQLESPAGSSTAGRFEWVDGSLTRAIQQGSWVLLDNANLVNPTVLDRLNGLLEPHGVLQLDEAGGGGSGGGRVVVPHPNFRLILAYDPKHGEVSRAMRNRGVELYLLPSAAGSAGSSSSSGRELAGAGKGAAEEQQEVRRVVV
jgi:midasin